MSLHHFPEVGIAGRYQRIHHRCPNLLITLARELSRQASAALLPRCVLIEFRLYYKGGTLSLEPDGCFLAWATPDEITLDDSMTEVNG